MTKISHSPVKFVLLALCVALSGCMMSGGADQSTLYTLSATKQFEDNLPTVKSQLAVALPTASEGLDTSRIAVMEEPLQLDYYRGISWIEPSPSLVQSLLVESFENSGHTQAVGREGMGVLPDYILSLDLRDFQVENVKNPAVAHVRLTAQLISATQRTIIAVQSFDVSKPVQGGGSEAIAAAFDAAARDVFGQVVAWTLRTAAS